MNEALYNDLCQQIQQVGGRWRIPFVDLCSWLEEHHYEAEQVIYLLERELLYDQATATENVFCFSLERNIL